jgi:hypothetical protein
VSLRAQYRPVVVESTTTVGPSPAQRYLPFIVAGIVLILFVFAYLRPRNQTIEQAQRDLDATIKARKDVAAILPDLDAEIVPTPPDPKPDVAGWLNSNVLNGLETKLISNQPSSDGRGATMKLRNMQPNDLAHFLNQLTAVNLQIKELKLEDLAATGRWDLNLTVETPEKPKATP